MGLVDAVVDDPDLDPLTRSRQRGAPEGGRFDQRDALVEQRVVLDAFVDASDAGESREAVDLSAGDDDRERVEDVAVVPADLRRRDLGGDSLL